MTVGPPASQGSGDEAASVPRQELFSAWSRRCLAADWALAAIVVAVSTVTLSTPWAVALVALVVLALGCVVLAALAVRASPTHSWTWLLTIGVLNLVLTPSVVVVVSLLANIAIHGFDLPT